MKKNIIRFFAVAALFSLAALACTKTEEDIDDAVLQGGGETAEAGTGEVTPGSDGNVHIFASVEDASVTKTSLGAADASGNRQVNWVENDEVKVLYDGGSVVAKAADPDGGKAKFSFTAPDGDLWFSYPSTAGELSGGVLSVEIPAVQGGSFAANGYLVAKGNTSVSGVKFFNACSMFKIVVDDPELKKAVITGNGGEPLAGTVKFSWTGANDEAPTPDVTAATGTSLTVTLNGAGEYYVATLPGLDLTTGATVRFFKEGDVPAGGNRTSAALTVARAKIASFGNSDAICHRYVSATASGTDNGRTPATAWNTTQFENFLKGKWNGADTDADKMVAMDGLTVHIAAGEYNMTDPAILLDAPATGNSLFTLLSIVGADGAVLKGNGTDKAILHQNNAYRAGTVVEFRNLTFTDGSRSGDHGGAIWQSYGIFKYKNCTFTGNKTVTESKFGGVLHYYGSPTAVFEDCTFSGNSAAGANDTANGGVMNITGTAKLSFTRCKFYNNSATNDAGVAYVNSKNADVLFDDCDFGDGTDANQNKTTKAGGVFGVKAAKSLNIINCRFNNNTATNGGAINFESGASTMAADAVHVTGCTFTNHVTSSSGAVIRVVGGTLNLESNTFTDNGSEEKSAGVALVTGGNLIDYGSVYKRNKALWGGVFCTDADKASILSCTQSKFGTGGNNGDKNYAKNGGGVFNQNGGSATFDMCEFYGNEAKERQGGAIRRATDGEATDVSLTVKGCIFKDNICSNASTTGGSSWGSSGAIFYQKGKLTITESDDHSRTTFVGNNSVFRGGAIGLDLTAEADISHADFRGNYTSGPNNGQLLGGAICVIGTSSASISDCTFNGNYNNTVGYGGGAIGIGGTTVKVKVNRTIFKDNYARSGGAIFNVSQGGIIYLNACAFTGNYITTTYGVVINLNNASSATATLCMNNCSFADNQYAQADATGQQSCWVNMKGLTKVVMSNSSLIGRTRNANGSSKADGTNPNLFRFDGAVGSGNYLINNIIAMTPESGTYYSSDMQSSTVTGFYNKMSAVRGGGNYTPGDGSASDFRGTSAYFGGLGTAMTEGKSATGCYWSWNGTLATGSNTDKATLADVNAKIQTADGDFYTWLDSIGALTTDCRGKDRGATTWPGAYDATIN